MSSPIRKNILIYRNAKSDAYPLSPVPPRGRLENVTDAGQDAVDADGPITNGTEADGKDVWS